jgi:formylglycine-generating enzyme required for sulfatase activity
MRVAKLVIFCVALLVNASVHAEYEMKIISSRSTGMQFVPIPKGTFTMGSPDGEPERDKDETQHQVTLTQDFFLGKYEVTQAEYETVMGYNPSYFKGKRRPVEQVSWYDAVWFCNQMSERDGRTPYYTITGEVRNGQSIKKATVTIQGDATGYRLPTEAEWEYACRAGEKGPFSFGANITPQQVNYDGDYPYDGAKTGMNRIKTVDVDTLPGNRFNLHQMHGNVYEWCWDRYADYSSGSTTDPVGPSTGSFRVLRGGSWYDCGARFCRSAVRDDRAPDYRWGSLGFRVAVGR